MNSAPCPAGRDRRPVRCPSQPPGSLEDGDVAALRTSVIFCTTTRSPISSVFSIDSDGMMNIWPTKARSRDDTTSAPTTTISRLLGRTRRIARRRAALGGVSPSPALPRHDPHACRAIARRLNSWPPVRRRSRGRTGAGSPARHAGVRSRERPADAHRRAARPRRSARPTTRSRGTKAFSPLTAPACTSLRWQRESRLALAVVAEDEDPVGRHHHVEADLRRIGPIAVRERIEIGRSRPAVRR